MIPDHMWTAPYKKNYISYITQNIVLVVILSNIINFQLPFHPLLVVKVAVVVLVVLEMVIAMGW